MARGRYDSTIKEEVNRRGKNQRGSSRGEDRGGSQRDEAVRRMNVRRDQRAGRPANLMQSTAYTPEEEAAPRKTRGGRGSIRASDATRGGTTKQRGPRDPVLPPTAPIPTPRPQDFVSGPYIVAPGYRPEDDPRPQPPDGGGGGPGGGGGGPVDPRLLPLLLAGAARPKADPRTPSIEETIIRSAQPNQDIVDVPYEVLPDQPRLAAPQNAPVPSPQQVPQLAAPNEAPMEVITDDMLKDVPVEMPRVKPKVRVKAPSVRIH